MTARLKNFRFEGQAFFLHILQRVGADIDVENILENDRAFVELLGDEMGGAAVNAHAAFVRLLVRSGPGEIGQQRGMNVDDPAGEGFDDPRRKNAHVSGQHDQIRLERSAGSSAASQNVFPDRRMDDKRNGQPGCFGERFEIGMIGKDCRQGEPFSLLCAKSSNKPVQAMRFLADEDGDFLEAPFAVEMDAHLHVQSACPVRASR